jgi:hypothetical protein
MRSKPAGGKDLPPVAARLVTLAGDLDQAVTAQDVGKVAQLVEPFITLDTPEITPADPQGWARSAIGQGLGAYLLTRGGGVTLDELVTILDRLGIDHEAVELTTKQALPIAGITERTLRRYIGSGKLIPREIKTEHGKTHLFTVAHLSDVFSSRADVIEKARTNPIEDLAGSVQAMAAGFDDVIRDQKRSAQQLQETIEAQGRIIEAQGKIIEELRAEQRDTRAQLHQLHETTVKALMPRDKPSFWSRITGRGNPSD